MARKSPKKSYCTNCRNFTLTEVESRPPVPPATQRTVRFLCILCLKPKAES